MSVMCAKFAHILFAFIIVTVHLNNNKLILLARFCVSVQSSNK